MTTTMIITTTMSTGPTAITTGTDPAALARLLAWLSPAYPIGAFSYSHGLEMAVEDGAVTKREHLVAYVEAALSHGAGAVDGGLLALAWRAAAAGDDAMLDELTDLAASWRGTAELALEAMQPGQAFALATNAAWPEPRFAAYAARNPGRLTHAVAFGAAAAFHGISLRDAVFGWLTGFATNIVSAGVRVVPLGQTDGQVATAALLPIVLRATEAALAVTDPDDLGAAAIAIDLFSLRHETQYTRLFRS
ncbi:urease accessory protein UreF [Falsiroseomonas ponticola]|uniref:urease accessory protein UreF n=1 Tax=Falsiroseomonas ponticola TaxID=2786951 RepID=UPI001CF7E67A|nr:urease accessory UreF family protein [Roseomonas ponticola]